MPGRLSHLCTICVCMIVIVSSVIVSLWAVDGGRLLRGM